jgi:hypothetical protein
MARHSKFDPEEMDPEELEEKLEEEGNFDSRGLLRDGQTLRVPLYLRDGAINPRLTPTQRAKAQHDQQTADARARQFGLTDALQFHRPGFRRNTDAAALARARQAYAAYDAADAAAYKQTRDYSEHTGGDPDRTGTGAPGRGSNAPAGAYPLSAGEGTACTINGAAGTLVRQGNSLVCQPRRATDAAAFDAKAQAYADYDREMANAWRGPNR